MKYILFCICLIILLSGCAPAAQPEDSSSLPENESSLSQAESELSSLLESSSQPEETNPNPGTVISPYSLSELGYRLAIPEDIGIYDTNEYQEGRDLVHQHFDPPLYFVQNEETVYMYGTYLYNSYGGDNLLGTYTAIHPNCQYQGMSADTDICFVLLQTFKTEDIQKPYAKVAFLKTSYSSAQVKQYEEYTLDVALLEDYIIYQDDTIIVYDFFEFTDAPSLNEQLKSLEEQARFAELGIDLSWISDMRDYFLETDGGVGRFITKS